MNELLWILLATCAAEVAGDPGTAPPGAGCPAPEEFEEPEALELEALRALPYEELRAALVVRAEQPDRGDEARVVELSVLAELGTEDDLDLALALAGGPTASSSCVASELQRAVAAILARHPAGRSRATRLAMNAPSGHAVALVRAVAATGADAQPELAALLGRTFELDLTVLSALVGNVRASGPCAEASEVAEAARPLLQGEDPQVQREACALAAELGDAQAVPVLVELLGTESGAPAHVALVTITGLAWETDPERWRTWLLAEQDWFARQAPSLFADLGDTPAQRALAALGELGGHRYRRDRIGAEVLRALEHAALEVRVAACGTLERLEWTGATAALVDVLTHDRPEVVAAAGRTLRALTGLEHADDELDAWRDVVSD